MKAPLLLDVDGVLADFKAHLLHAVESNVSPEHIERYEIFDYLTPSQRMFAMDLCEQPGWWRGLNAIPGAVEAVRQLRELATEIEFEIVFVTQPWKACPGWIEAREAWLMRHFNAEGIGHDIFPIRGVRKHLIRGKAFVEDSPEALDAWKAASAAVGLSFVFDQPYNRMHLGHERLFGWSEQSVFTLANAMRC